MNFLVVSGASLAVLLVGYLATFLVGRRLGRYNVVDVTWRAGFVAVAAVAAAVGTGDLARRMLLPALVVIWGLRLAWHVVGKSAERGEDPRYEARLRGDFSAALLPVLGSGVVCRPIGWVSLASVPSPIAMSYFLVYATGARLTEKFVAGRPGFVEYCSRTSFFDSMPPKRRES